MLTSAPFDTIRVRVPGRAHKLQREAAARGLNIWVVDADTLSLSCDETTTAEDLDTVFAACLLYTSRCV